MSEIEIISATEFKAKCLEIFDRLGARKLTRVTITKRGKPVAVLIPPEGASAKRNLHGFMRGSVIFEGDIDLTEPVIKELFTVEKGKLHE